MIFDIEGNFIIDYLGFGLRRLLVSFAVLIGVLKIFQEKRVDACLHGQAEDFSV